MIDDKFGMPINYIQMGGSRWFNAERTLTKVPMRPDYMERNAFHRQNLAVNLGLATRRTIEQRPPRRFEIRSPEPLARFEVISLAPFIPCIDEDEIAVT